MSKALKSALEAVQRMSPGSEIDPELWTSFLEEMRKEHERLSKARTEER